MSDTRSDARRKALQALIEAHVPGRFATQSEMAKALGFVEAHFSQMKTGNRSIGNASVDRIEQGLGLARGFMDAPVAGPTSAVGAAAAIPDKNEALLVAAYRAASADARGLLLAAAKAAMTQHPLAVAEDRRNGYKITRNTSDSPTANASSTSKKIRYKK